MTQLEFKLANSNSGSCRTTLHIEHNTRRLFWQHLSRKPQCVDDEATPRMHAW